LPTILLNTEAQVYDHTQGRAINTPKSYGKSIKAADLPLGISKFFPLATSDAPRGQGLPKELLHRVLQGILTAVQRIREAVQSAEMRMVGGSILVVYEADWDRLRKCLEEWPMDADELEDYEEPDEDDADDGSGVVGEGDGKTGPPYLVKLIDFAHTSVREGEGPDKGVLLGLDTVINLLEGRIDQFTGL